MDELNDEIALSLTRDAEGVAFESMGGYVLVGRHGRSGWAYAVTYLEPGDLIARLIAAHPLSRDEKLPTLDLPGVRRIA